MSDRPERTTRTLKADVLARVEGEGAMYVRLEGDRVEEVRLQIYEPPRFFEAFLRGRRFSEAPDITARICGICPVAYQMSSIAAMEDVCAVDAGEQVRLLRRLLYCGEWIESHTLHLFLLHAPDFLGYDSAMDMARDHRDIVERALFLKKTGNEVMQVVGGREIHPVNVRVGGFYRAPRRDELAPVRERLERAHEVALESVSFAAGLDFPDYEHDYEFVALSHPDEYAIERGRLVSSGGLDIAPGEYDEHFVEEHVEHSNALHCRLEGVGNYLVGPLARWALGSERMTGGARAAAAEVGLEPVCRNPFRSIIVRAVETLYAVEESIRIIDSYEPPDPPAAEVRPRAGTGYGWTEAPRGTLYHRYRLDADGLIEDAKIVPPTSQNQAMIEQDLRGFVGLHASLPDPELSLRCEQAIRNYDPCISCATHFLRLDVDRR